MHNVALDAVTITTAFAAAFAAAFANTAALAATHAMQGCRDARRALRKGDALVARQQQRAGVVGSALGFGAQDRLELGLRQMRHLARRGAAQRGPRLSTRVVLRCDLRAKEARAVAEVAPLVERRRLGAHRRLYAELAQELH